MKRLSLFICFAFVFVVYGASETNRIEDAFDPDEAAWSNAWTSGSVSLPWTWTNTYEAASNVVQLGVGDFFNTSSAMEYRQDLAPEGVGNIRVRLHVFNGGSVTDYKRPYIKTQIYTGGVWNDLSYSGDGTDRLTLYDGSYVSPTWVEEEFSGFFDGINSNVQFRIVGFAGGGLARKDIYIDAAQLEFLATAKLQANSLPIDVSYDDTPEVRVDSLPLPADKVTVTNATMHWWRELPDGAGITATNNAAMSNVSNDTWAVTMPQFPSGTPIHYYFTTGFEVSPTNTPRMVEADSLYADNGSQTPFNYTVEGAGSVWINEIHPGSGDGFIELCAATNRSPIAGWRVLFLGVADQIIASNTISSADFSTNNYNGFSFAVVSNLTVLSGPFETIELRNELGYLEQTINGYTTIPDGDSWGAAGTLNPGETYFNSEALRYTTLAESMGGVNADQAFGLGYMLNVSGEVRDAASSNAMTDASVVMTIDGATNAWDVSQNVSVDSNAIYSLSAISLTNGSNQGSADFTYSAFGYGVVSTIGVPLDLTRPEEQAFANQLPLIVMSGSSEAEETFSGSKPGFWEVTSSNPSYKWAYSGDDAEGLMLFNAANTFNETTKLTAKNALMTFSNTVCSVQVDYTKGVTTDYKATRLSFEYGLNDWSSPQVVADEFNNYSVSSIESWHHGQLIISDQSLETNSMRICFEAAAGSGYSRKDFEIDNINVRFYNDISIDYLEAIPNALMYTDGLGFDTELSPMGEGITNVQTRLMYSINGGTWQESDSVSLLPGEYPFTNQVAVSDAAAIPAGTFVPDDTVDYYLKVTYDMTEAHGGLTNIVKYFPDNTEQVSASVQKVDGEYAGVPRSAVAQDLKRVWINEVYYNSADTNNHFVELAGSANLDLTGGSIEISDLTTEDDDVIGTYLFGASALDQNVSGSVGFNGLGPSTPPFAMALTNALPPSGLIRIYNPSNQCVDAVAYGANVADAPGSTDIGDDPVNGRLVATGAGPVSNSEFNWMGTNTVSVGQINPAQDFTDTSGPQIVDPGVDVTDVQIDQMTVTPSEAVDFSEPVDYKLSGGNLPAMDWTNALSTVTDTNLSENTPYTYTVTARDAISNESSMAVTNYTAISAPTNILKSAATTNSITVAVNTNPTLGNGDSAVLYTSGGVSNLSTSGSATFSGLGTPNGLHQVTAQSRNGDGIYADGVVTGSFYTAAASAPIPNADIVGPRTLNIQMNVNSENPSYTDYALSYTNDLGNRWYIADDGTQNTNAPVWTNNWPATVTASGLQGSELGVMTLVQNEDGDIAYPASDAATNVEFVITADITNAVQSTDGTGAVTLDIEVYNYQTDNARLSLVSSNEVTGATNAMLLADVASAYSNGTAFVTNGQPYQVDGVIFNSNAWNTLSITWNATEDGFDNYNSNVTFFVEIDSTNATARTFGDNETLLLDFLPPQMEAGDLSGVPSGTVTNTAATISITNTDVDRYQYRTQHNSDGWSGWSDITNRATDLVLSGLADGLTTLEVTAADEFGNWMAVSNVVSTSWTVDTTAPSKAATHLVGAPSGLDNRTNLTISVTNDVDDVAEIRYRLNDGAWAVAQSSLEFDVTGLVTGPVTLDVIGADALGNWMSTNDAVSASWTVDVTAPAVALTSPVGSPFSNATFTVTATFSEDVTGFDATDVSVSNGSVGSFNTVSATSYTFVVTPTTEGEVTVDVSAGSCVDLASNSNTAATQLSRTHDATQPTVALTSPVGSPFSNATFTVTATFSEDVTGFDATDVSVSNGSASSFNAVSATSYTFVVTPTTDGEVTVDVSAGSCVDLASNPNTAATQLSRTHDATQPTVALTSPVGSPFTNATFAVTATFSEEVTGFDATDISVSNGSAGSFNAVSATSYTFVVTPTTDGEVTVDVNAGICSDVAGNLNTAAPTLSRTYDSVQPAVTLSTSIGSPFTNATFTVTATFSEEVTGFDATDVSVSNGSAGSFNTMSALNYTFVVTPSGQGAVTVDVNAGVCADPSSNPNTAATTLSRTYDTLPPAAVLLINAPTGLVNSGSADITVGGAEVAAYSYRYREGTVANAWADWTAATSVVAHLELSGLQAGTVWLEVHGYDAAGNRTVTPTNAQWVVNITPPEWLAAGPIGDGTFTLNWEEPVNGDGYRIEVASDTNFVGSIAHTNTSISNLTLSVTGVGIGSTNYCRIQTLLGASSSSFGETLKVAAFADVPYPVNRIPSEMTVTVGGSDIWNLDELFNGAGLNFAVTSGTPSVVSAVLTGSSVELDYLTVGSAQVAISAQNAAGVASTVEILFHVTPAAQIGGTFSNPDFVTNLNVYAQTVSVTNNTGFAAHAVKLTFTGILPVNTTLREATSQSGTNAVIIWNGELAPGASVDLDLTYFNPALTPVTVGSITAEFSLVDVLPDVALDAPIGGLALHRDLNSVGIDSFLLEFPTVPGATYYVFYRDSLGSGDWIRVQNPVVAHGVWCMWFDPGPPVTAPHGASRFYQVQRQQ